MYDDNIKDRIFWNPEGWFIRLHEYDSTLTACTGLRVMNISIGETGVVAGPFLSRGQLERWIQGFLDRYFDPWDGARVRADHLKISQCAERWLDKVATCRPKPDLSAYRTCKGCNPGREWGTLELAPV